MPVVSAGVLESVMSEFTPAISLDAALKQQFSAATLEELRHYWREKTGTDAPAKMNGPTLRTKLLRECGIVNEFTGAKVGVFKPGQEPIKPPYNLSPNGKWGGRRHRIVVGKPVDATKNENAMSLSWNGAPSYYIRFGEVQAVPEPVYDRLRVMQRPICAPKRTVHDDGAVEITTDIKLEPRYQISYMGIDPATADRAGSLTEWYQQKGPGWFHARTWRDCQLIAQMLEMQWQDEEKRPLAHDVILPRLIEFFFGYADAQDPDPEAKAA
jgi:hypothetical protein